MSLRFALCAFPERLDSTQHRCAVFLTLSAWMRLRSMPHDN